MAVRLHLLTQHRMILDNPVMHDRDLFIGHMRMGVAFRYTAMRCPAGVTNAGGPGQRAFAHHRLQIDQLANRPVHREMAILLGHDPGTVIAAIFKPFQRIQKCFTASS